jgi:hypothetical protein
LGDTAAIYAIHDISALSEMKEKAYIQNVINFDQNSDMLATIRHEALYAAFILTRLNFNEEDIICSINDLNNLPESLEMWNDKLSSTVIFEEKAYSYGMALFNKFCGFNKILIDKSIGKKESDYVSKTLFYNNKTNKEYYDALTSLSTKLFYFISITNHIPSLDIEGMVHLKDSNSKRMLKNLPNNNTKLGYALADCISTKCINNLNHESSLYKLYKSGSRFSKAQLVRSCIVIGYSADAENKVIMQPIRSSLLEGLTEDQYFRVSPGTRKSIADKSRSTPESGYLERTLVMALAMLELDMDDCGTQTYLEPNVSSPMFAATLVDKYYRDPLKSDLEWKILDYKTAMTFINRIIEIRSPMTCINPDFKVCRMCFGTKKLASIYVGIIAGQSITERLTQLTLRTFHESGRAILDIPIEISTFFTEHLLDVIKNVDGTVKLYFDSSDFPITLIDSKSTIQGLIEINYEDSFLLYGNDLNIIANSDVIKIMEDIKILLKNGHIGKTTQPVHFYENMMVSILAVGTVYSSFVELLFANMLLVDYEYKIFWRYNQNQRPTYKLGDKSMASYINPLLGLLYQPNKASIDKIDLDIDIDDISNESKLTIYEKIFLNKL